MLMHRIKTLGHIVATTEIPWRKKKDKYNADDMLKQEGIKMIKEWQNSYEVIMNYINLEKYRNRQNRYNILSTYKNIKNSTLPIQPADDGSHITMKGAVQKIMDTLTTGTEEQQKKYSKGLNLGDDKASKGWNRRATITALSKLNQTYKEQKGTMKVGQNIKYYNISLCMNQLYMCLNIQNVHTKIFLSLLKEEKSPAGGTMSLPIVEDDESNPHNSVRKTLSQTDSESFKIPRVNIANIPSETNLS